MQEPAGDFFTGMLWMMIVVWTLGIAATVFWLWMLIDALVHVRETTEKILWFLVIFFLHFIGAIIYFVMKKSGGARLAHH